MKKIVMSLLLAATAIGGASTASAWGFTHCKTASDMGAAMISNDLIARHCHQFIVGEGLISKGVDAGKEWKSIYGDNVFPHADNGKSRMVNVKKFNHLQYAWRIDGHRALRTKEIATEDITEYMTHIGFELNDTHSTVSGHEVYTVNLEEGVE